MEQKDKHLKSKSILLVEYNYYFHSLYTPVQILLRDPIRFE